MKSFTLKDIPDDVRKHILKVQGDKKIEKNAGQYSQCLAVFQIVREHKELTDKKKP